MPGRAKSRSYHSKSRGGCVACRKRHIKCDQKRPACTNCTTRSLHCPFEDAAVPCETTSSTGHDPASLWPSPSAFDSHSTGTSPLPQHHGATNVSITHLELYTHFLFNVCPTFTGQPRHDESYRNLCINAAFKHHFVLYEMLGLAALSKHLASPSEKYQALAASFQEKAIGGLDNILTKVTSENCVAVVLFGHLVGAHSFCDTFASAPNTTFHAFLESLVGSAQLLRGIMSVLRPFWNDLAATEVGEFMKDARNRRAAMAGCFNDETASLRALIGNADISQASRETYENAIMWLQRDFDEINALPLEQRATTNTAFAWLTTASPAYLQLMGEARPEALVILAWFAVVLHHRRGCWAIGTAGYTILKSVMSHLGPPWKQWLAWPQSEIANDFPDLIVEDMSI